MFSPCYVLVTILYIQVVYQHEYTQYQVLIINLLFNYYTNMNLYNNINTVIFYTTYSTYTP
jgi:hypothetical protein